MRARPIALTVAAVAAAAVLAACSSSNSMSGHQMSDGSMMSGPSMSSAMPTGSEGDVAFAQLMIPHHEQAVEMADLALDPATGASQEVTALATQIKAAQDPEIAEMTSWLTDWGAPTQMPGHSDDMAHSAMGGMQMSGMMSAEDMSTLGSARGEQFDRMWLSMMIAHHQGAIDMADQVLTTTADPEVEALAQAVIDGQTAEIEQMQRMLRP